MNKTILIVEDDKEINHLLADLLQTNGYLTTCLFDGLKVLDTLKNNRIDLILLDIMLPYKNGDVLLAEIRREFLDPVIIISAKGTTQNKIDLLRLGADDYITKPFDMEETLARIESNLRRAALNKKPDAVFRYRNLTLYPEKLTAFIGEEELTLTAKEYRILELLIQYPDKVFSKANLFQSVWGAAYLSEDNTLNVHVSNLRNKLKNVCRTQDYIDTVWGIGYRLHQG